jgi:hypothetical protein
MVVEDVEEALVRMLKDAESVESVVDLDVDAKVEEVVAPDEDMLEERPGKVVDTSLLDVPDEIDVLVEIPDAPFVPTEAGGEVDWEVLVLEAAAAVVAVLDIAVVGASVGGETLELRLTIDVLVSVVSDEPAPTVDNGVGDLVDTLVETGVENDVLIADELELWDWELPEANPPVVEEREK